MDNCFNNKKSAAVKIFDLLKAMACAVATSQMVATSQPRNIVTRAMCFESRHQAKEVIKTRK